MAISPKGKELTLAHISAQRRIGQRMITQMASVWRLVDISDIDASLQRWLSVALPVVKAGSSQSAQTAAAYSTAFRVAEVGERQVFRRISNVDTKALVTSLTVTGPVRTKAAIARGIKVSVAFDLGRTGTAAAGMRYALDGGRSTILNTVKSDERALGYSRVAGGRACAFCAMLASRGPVYLTEESAEFQAHDNCACSVEPIYHEETDWSPNAEKYRQIWDEQASDAANPLNAFRKALNR